MAKIGFYVKTASLLLALAVSSLVGCAGESFSSANSDAGVTDVTTGGQPVVSYQSSVVSQNTGGSSVVSTQSSATSGSSGGSSTVNTVVMNRYYVVYSNSVITYSSDPLWQSDRVAAQNAIGTCARITSGVNYSLGCACIAGEAQVYSGTFSTACTGLSGLQCQGLSTHDTSQYYVLTWECPATIPNSADVVTTGGASSVAATGGASSIAATGGASSIAATGGASSIAATGGASSIAATGGASSVAATGGTSAVVATGGSSAVAPTTYSVTYQNQVPSQSVQAPGTCPSGQTVTDCTCVITGLSTLTSCNPTACQIENSKQYPQSIFTWSCT